jgi:hypothetical protein
MQSNWVSLASLATCQKILASQLVFSGAPLPAQPISPKATTKHKTRTALMDAIFISFILKPPFLNGYSHASFARPKTEKPRIGH